LLAVYYCSLTQVQFTASFLRSSQSSHVPSDHAPRQVVLPEPQKPEKPEASEKMESEGSMFQVP